MSDTERPTSLPSRVRALLDLQEPLPEHLVTLSIDGQPLAQAQQGPANSSVIGVMCSIALAAALVLIPMSRLNAPFIQEAATPLPQAEAPQAPRLENLPPMPPSAATLGQEQQASPSSAQQPATQTPIEAVQLVCNGTEPFWDVLVEEDLMVFNDPMDDRKKLLTIVSRLGPIGPKGQMVIETKFTRLMIEQGQCSDGMSDIRYPRIARFELGSRVYTGCCR